MELSITKIILVVFPDGLLTSYVGLGLIGVRTKARNHFKIATIFMIFLIVVRNILKLYGLHVILGILFLSLLFKVIVKIEWELALIASLLAYILMSLGELVLATILSYMDFDVVNFVSDGHLICLLYTSPSPRD